MSQTSSKPFGPIRDAYAFFSRMRDGNRSGYPCLPAPYPWCGAGDSPLRLLDFGVAMAALPPPYLAASAYLLHACGSPSWNLMMSTGTRQSSSSNLTVPNQYRRGQPYLRTYMPASTWWWRIMSCTMCLI